MLRRAARGQQGCGPRWQRSCGNDGNVIRDIDALGVCGRQGASSAGEVLCLGVLRHVLCSVVTPCSAAIGFTCLLSLPSPLIPAPLSTASRNRDHRGWVGLRPLGGA